MNDMSTVIIPRSDQQNADDFLAGPRTITVTQVSIRPGTEQPVSIHFEGDEGKPLKPCKSMCRVMVSLWGADASKYVGKSMTLYCDPTVKFGGLAVGGIRISHMSHIDNQATLMLTATKGSRKPFIVKPLVMPKPDDQKPPAVDPKPSEAPAIDADHIFKMAENAAGDGNDALTKHLLGLPKSHKDALKPRGAELRAMAQQADDAMANDAQEPSNE